MSKEINKIAVLTSGGDAPGMNAAIRAVVRACIFYNKKVIGVYRGYNGLINGEFEELGARSVNTIMSRGGTVLKSARSEGFRTKEGRKTAFENLKNAGIDALVTIGGDGTFTGANLFSQEYDIPVLGIPATIDNDLAGTDYCIGFDSACNTVTDAIDKIKDTASSHERLFFVEVMGRDAGFIAVKAGIGGGAVAMLIPEFEWDIDMFITRLKRGAKNEKTSNLVVIAEGNKFGNAFEIADRVKEKIDDYDIRVTILGHLQRGGAPSSLDRVLASRLGVSAVEGLLNGQSNVMAGQIDNKMIYVPLEEAINGDKSLNHDEFRIAKILSI